MNLDNIPYTFNTLMKIIKIIKSLNIRLKYKI